MQDTYVCLDVYVVLVSVIPIPDPLTPPTRWRYDGHIDPFFYPLKEVPFVLSLSEPSAIRVQELNSPSSGPKPPNPHFDSTIYGST